MSAAGRIGWGIVKWLLIPAGLGAVGYYYVGPQFGKTSGLKPQEVLQMAGQTVAPSGGMPPPPPIEPPKRQLGEPEVEVTVSRSRTAPARSRPVRRESTRRSSARTNRSESTAAQKSEEPPAEPPAPTETPDEAGAGGMTGPESEG